MKYFLVFSLSLFLATSCGDANADAADQAAAEAANAAESEAYELMMEGHDRVMPRMGEVVQAQRTLAERLQIPGLSEEQRDLLTASNEQLEDSADGMMEWMSSVKPLDDLRAEMDNEGIMSYIKEKTAEIAKVESDITASIASAKELIEGDHVHTDGEADHEH